MAIQVEKANGERTRHRRASRLRRKETGEGGILKHKAAVLPAKKRAVKVIPTKAVDEWPEGNDFRPSRTLWTSLRFVNDDSVGRK
jgi:hypothetical protein